MILGENFSTLSALKSRDFHENKLKTGRMCINQFSLFSWGWSSWPFLLTGCLIILVFLPLSWTHFFWSRYVTNIVDDPPKNKLINLLCKSSKLVTNSFAVRLVMFIMIYIFFGLCVIMELVSMSGNNSLITLTCYYKTFWFVKTTRVIWCKYTLQN